VPHLFKEVEYVEGGTAHLAELFYFKYVVTDEEVVYDVLSDPSSALQESWTTEDVLESYKQISRKADALALGALAEASFRDAREASFRNARLASSGDGDPDGTDCRSDAAEH
jgi:hypothetical protein